MKASKKAKHQILVVDDDPSVCKSIKMLLAHDGHEVQTVFSAESALTVLTDAKFDLIITDYSMPGMKGDQFVTLVKQARPEQRILIATASVEILNPNGTPFNLMDGILKKPFSLTILRDAITRVFPDHP